MELYSRVKIVNSGDPDLDGIKAIVLGFYGSSSAIVLLDKRPSNYDPAIVVVKEIIEEINEH